MNRDTLSMSYVGRSDIQMMSSFVRPITTSSDGITLDDLYDKMNSVSMQIAKEHSGQNIQLEQLQKKIDALQGVNRDLAERLSLAIIEVKRLSARALFMKLFGGFILFSAVNGLLVFCCPKVVAMLFSFVTLFISLIGFFIAEKVRG